MATLLEAVNASETLWQISAPIAQDTIYLKVGTEIVQVTSDFTGGTLLPTGATVPSKVRVKRPVGGTTAASHLQGATLTEYADASVFGGESGGGESAVLSAAVTLTDAQILALNTTPVELVAGIPGSVIVPSALFTITTLVTPYTGDPGNLLFGPDPAQNTWGVMDSTHLTFPENRLTLQSVSGGGVGVEFPIAVVEGAPLLLWAEDDNPADGNAANTMKVTVIYTVTEA